MGRVARPLFYRNKTYVAVRRIHLGSGQYVEPGEELKGFKVFHLKSLHQRRRIGPKDHPWTEMMLGSTGFPSVNVSDDTPTDPGVMLLGSNVLKSAYDIGGKEVALGEIVFHAQESSGLSVEEWNGLEDRQRETMLAATLQELMANSMSDVPDATKKESVEPVKDGSRWVVPGHEDVKFTSKKKAMEWLAEQPEPSEDDALSDDEPKAAESTDEPGSDAEDDGNSDEPKSDEDKSEDDFLS